MRPQYSPWGEIQHCVELCPGMYEVSTASHGGVMAKLGVASKLFSRAARAYSFVEGGYGSRFPTEECAFYRYQQRHRQQ